MGVGFSGWMDLTAVTLVAAVGAVGFAVAALIACHTLARVATCRDYGDEYRLAMGA